MENLSKVNSWDLVRELNKRGYYTKLIFSPSDVESMLDSINSDRDEEDGNIIVLTNEEKEEILDGCFNTDWHCERMNESIEEYILDNYDNEDYYQKVENVE